MLGLALDLLDAIVEMGVGHVHYKWEPGTRYSLATTSTRDGYFFAETFSTSASACVCAYMDICIHVNIDIWELLNLQEGPPRFRFDAAASSTALWTPP